MTDKRLEEIRARHSLFESSRILYEEKNRRRLVSDSAVLHADIGALLDLVDELQSKLEACEKLALGWPLKSLVTNGSHGAHECASEIAKVLING